jgi:hypothetical protein
MPAKRKTLQDEVADLMTVGAEPTVTPATGSHEPVGLKPVTAEDLAADRAYIAELDAAAAPETTDDAHGDGSAGVPEATAAEEPVGPDGSVAPPPVGSINAMVKELLADPGLSYEAIVDQVMAAHPTARTTARSVASTASVMRRKGETVPMRRAGKA